MNGLFSILGAILGAGLAGFGFWVGFRVGLNAGNPAKELPSGLLPGFEPSKSSAPTDGELAVAEAEEYDVPVNDPGSEYPVY